MNPNRKVQPNRFSPRHQQLVMGDGPRDGMGSTMIGTTTRFPVSPRLVRLCKRIGCCNSTFIVTDPTHCCSTLALLHHQILVRLLFWSLHTRSKQSPSIAPMVIGIGQTFVTSFRSEQKAEFPERIAKCSAALTAHARKVCSRS